jgi:hypothetical protein
MRQMQTYLNLTLATGLLVLLVLAAAGTPLMTDIGLASDACAEDAVGGGSGCSLPFVWWAAAAVCAGLYLAAALLALRTPRQRAGAKRVVACAVGIALVAIAAWGVLWVLFGVDYASQSPDPTAPLTDPDLGPPDTWGDVVGGAVSSLLLAAIDAALFSLAVALIWWSICARWLPVGRLALGPAAALVVVALAIATSQLA